ncbi:single-strand DNA-binding protein [Methylomarinovum tepidoasis]|uniref:Single-stranded DNA-binding protein n=1 Tax=Methylomarinovum tepidoasis TaxID=2840183 RepID=A0AAU9BXS7_9GAMM|nr:single-stranded DNA-binding protein [Methylomarinovum sp. IN45]BCX88505.1 single-strand DNA-binding protein [Methylomarinovum sp. IN45]
MMQAAIHGRLGRDPETRITSTGKTMATCSVAVDVTAHNAEADETIWIRLVAFRRLADQLARHRQGDMVSAFGRLVLNRWIGRDGEERTGWEMVANDLVSARTVRPGGGRRKKAAAQPAPVAAFDDDPMPL